MQSGENNKEISTLLPTNFKKVTKISKRVEVSYKMLVTVIKRDEHNCVLFTR